MRPSLKILFAVLSVSMTLLSAPVQVAGATTAPCALGLRVIDISSNNPHPINWKYVAKASISGAYIKATEGLNYVNPYFKTDAKGSASIGLPYGTYDYAQPSVDPIADAKYFVAHGGATGQLPPAPDYETPTKSASHDVAWAVAWLKEIQVLTGRVPIIYTGAYYSWSHSNALNAWSLWLPAYSAGYSHVNSACGLRSPVLPSAWAKKGWIMWQFTSRAKALGVPAYVDMSIAKESWFTSITGAGILQPTPKHPVPVPIYAPGSHGTTVTYVQQILYALNLIAKSGITGFYDIPTKTAVEAYQTLMGITADGLWSAETEGANAWYQVNHRPVETISNYPMLMSDTAFHGNVKWLQQKLVNAGYKLTVDGMFKTQTRIALIAFQRKHGVSKVWYGITDLTTWRLLWTY